MKKDTFMSKEGAIISNQTMLNGTGYTAIENVWHKVPLNTEYISSPIIEHPDNGDFFESVYPDTLKGNIYRAADQLRELYKKAFVE